jgi:hypothetical protein
VASAPLGYEQNESIVANALLSTKTLIPSEILFCSKAWTKQLHSSLVATDQSKVECVRLLLQTPTTIQTVGLFSAVAHNTRIAPAQNNK